MARLILVAVALLLSAAENSEAARSCSELKIANPSLPPGNYMIDPDGDNVGDPAFSAYCDMIERRW